MKRTIAVQNKGFARYRSESGFVQVILVLVILVVVIGGAYYLGTLKNKTNEVAAMPTETSVAMATQKPGIPTTKPTVDPTANWKTYQNDKYGFSFKFPEVLKDVGAIAGPYTGYSVVIQSFSDPSTIREGTDAHFDGFSVYYVTDLKTADFNAYIANEIKLMNEGPFASMVNPIKSVIPNGVVLTSQDSSQAYYYIPTEDNKQIVVFAYLQVNSSFKPMFDQILSTFKFTK